MNKNILSFVFLSITLGLVSQSNQTNCGFSIKKAAKITALSTFGLCVYRLYSKKSATEPVIRFETAKLTDAAKNFNITEIFNQVWYLIDDILIGQTSKKDGVKANKEGILEVSKTNCPSSGIMGNAESKIVTITKTIVAIKTASYLLRKINDYFNNDSTIEIELQEIF